MHFKNNLRFGEKLAEDGRFEDVSTFPFRAVKLLNVFVFR
jgi:hypothetical protein